MDPNAVQAIRCEGCKRLRRYPKTVGTLACLCGDRRFRESYPMPGEEAEAALLYESELRDAGLWVDNLPLLLEKGRA